MNAHSIASMRLVSTQRKHEGSTKVVPFLSFVLTHVALTLFLLATFFVHDLTGRILVAVPGVLLIASEWLYTILISIQWRRDIAARVLAEAESRQAFETVQRMAYEAHIDMERQRWLAEITRRRWLRQERQHQFS